MPSKKPPSAPTKSKKKGGRSQSNPPDPQSTEVEHVSENNLYLGIESSYDTAVTTISTSRTSRNSSAPIVIPLEPDGSYADPALRCQESEEDSRKTNHCGL